MGGYICASKKIIDFIRVNSAGVLYHNAMSPVVCSQILVSLQVIMGEDGTCTGQRKLNSLITNSNYFRQKLMDLGAHVLGDFDSPVIPVMIYLPAKICAFSRECLKRGLAVVVVGFPATSVILSRARFCVSAGHTKEDLDFALNVLSEVFDVLCMKYNKNFLGF